jgi:hypothetical protein
MWDFEKEYLQFNSEEKGLADKGYEGVIELLTPWKGIYLKF